MEVATPRSGSATASPSKPATLQQHAAFSPQLSREADDSADGSLGEHGSDFTQAAQQLPGVKAKFERTDSQAAAGCDPSNAGSNLSNGMRAADEAQTIHIDQQEPADSRADWQPPHAAQAASPGRSAAHSLARLAQQRTARCQHLYEQAAASPTAHAMAQTSAAQALDPDGHRKRSQLPPLQAAAASPQKKHKAVHGAL